MIVLLRLVAHVLLLVVIPALVVILALVVIHVLVVSHAHAHVINAIVVTRKVVVSILLIKSL